MLVLQLNLNHCRAAQDVLSQTARETKTDIALLSEPHRTGSDNRWAVDLSGKAAIWSCGATGATMHSVHSAEGFVRARIGGAWLYSCYMAPSLTTSEFERMMDCLGKDIRGRSDVLVAGDFNAWAQDWGCPRTNARGRVVRETFASLDLVLLNEGNQHTFSRAIIDLTFASPSHRAGEALYSSVQLICNHLEMHSECPSYQQQPIGLI
ncbi:uncharacterized protein [Drosophila bipectinata]|uniref:uncharacterized protein n=1 Tax=Drosophila bipectinata TaxID=42026 RepID=UPI0038B37ECA